MGWNGRDSSVSNTEQQAASIAGDGSPTVWRFSRDSRPSHAAAHLSGPAGAAVRRHLAMSRTDLALIWGASALVLAVMARIWRPLLAAIVNTDLSSVAGLRPARTRLIFGLLMATGCHVRYPRERQLPIMAICLPVRWRDRWWRRPDRTTHSGCLDRSPGAGIQAFDNRAVRELPPPAFPIGVAGGQGRPGRPRGRRQSTQPTPVGSGCNLLDAPQEAPVASRPTK